MNSTSKITRESNSTQYLNFSIQEVAKVYKKPQQSGSPNKYKVSDEHGAVPFQTGINVFLNGKKKLNYRTNIKAFY